MPDEIIIRGAREHNLKNINLNLPRNALIVFTGLSGSGKSSLAFDTIYAEGQRRYVESLSAYARQFLGQMEKPDVDLIQGLSPAISIDQKTASRNPRSTVGTVTEIYDYMRLLYARIGRPYCPHCRRPIQRQVVQQMVDQIMTLPEGTRLQVLAPLVRGRKGEHLRLLEEMRRRGFVRVRVDGEIRELEEEIVLDKNKKHNLEVVVDRLILREDEAGRLAESLETALKIGDGLVLVQEVGGGEHLFSERFACPECGFSFEEISPRIFSFNSPYGACPECSGLGTRMEFSPELIIPFPELSVLEGAIHPFKGNSGGYYQQFLQAALRQLGIDPALPFKQLGEKQRELLFYGFPEPVSFRYVNRFGRVRIFRKVFPGIIKLLERRYNNTESELVRAELSQYMVEKTCHQCRGRRLKDSSLSVLVGGRNIAEVAALNVEQAGLFFSSLELTPRERQIGERVLKEIQERLQFLRNVGLPYLTLDRATATLSGGEAQRIRLATQIGSGLTGVIYILDEPSIGLHLRDNARLLATLQQLRDLGNTVIVVEHDEGTIRCADHIVDIGPGAGAHGGRIVAQGTLEEIMATPGSITGDYLAGRRKISVPQRRRRPTERRLCIRGAQEHNLKNIDVEIPLGLFVGVSGVSGSGKSTLVNGILARALARQLHRARTTPGRHLGIEGIEHLDKVIEIDQSPIGRTPRSNPATYTGLFDGIRELFSRTVEARKRGYRPGRFSFNVKGGRCEACRGDGILRIEMHFLPDVYVPCEVCRGLRYNRETLEVRYKDKNIAEVLDMTVEEALSFFEAIPRVRRKLQYLYDVGLGYIRLGQPATTLSGGEAQRVKLATELSRRSNGRTIYILDEPTTGLHLEDISKLLEVLERLTDAGNTVVVIEHNLEVLKRVDYLIDLGPEGGDDGGQVVAAGTPEDVACCPRSYTGQFLRQVLNIDSRCRAGQN
ncbi:MAG TPA: excinuclease ABC subunit UvrA [Bacillota bacterium]|jgi:excinuclease ABC subunit A|nr:excinuclease ABC subunit UvrA [Bacillota bacterium]HOB87216.1 excinuclease ABC subunit UvrA [Bacillota bacterium]HOP68166.1 excinuclease ABC subunit UvrA [Bacillota bacterium]HPT33036.1 excinuclease ABC subunit UvrA [Bacillota bacterium]HQD05260.1 excinuclease ABC subunit UvrA [Bacillota bacterium]